MAHMVFGGGEKGFSVLKTVILLGGLGAVILK